MLIELLQNETHTVHEAVHVVRIAIPTTTTLNTAASPASVRRERSLESFKILHPLDGKIVLLDVSLIEDEDEGELRLVQYT